MPVFVRRGHVVYTETDATSTNFFMTMPAQPETPREQARARQAAAARWRQIVDLMLAGQRETGGGRVIRA